MEDWSVALKPGEITDHSDIVAFVDYCYEFYGPDGVYPDARVTKQIIFRAAWSYLKLIATNNYNSTSKVEFHGDTMDRENTYRYIDLLINLDGGTK